MAVFFQKISDDQFNINSDFLVMESKKMNVVTGIFLLIFSIAAFAMNILAGIVVLIFAISAFARTAKDKIIMKINKQGFYYFGELITDWDHFISEEFIDELPLPSGNNPGANDKFFLMIKYFKDGYPGYYGRKIPLTANQDKAEEEIIAAVKFYYKNSQKINQ
jgi:hypothetical protein